MRPLGRFGTFLWLPLLLALGGCGGGTLVSAPLTPLPSSTLTVAITLAAPDSSVTAVSLTATPVNGDPAVTASRSCASNGCNASFNAPLGSNTLKVDLTDAQSHVVRSGAMHVFVQTGGTTVGVAFGGTPAIIKLSAEPGSFTNGTAATAVVRVLAYDASGNRMLGSIAFPSAVTITQSDASGKMQLSGSSISAPDQTLTLTYNGNGVVETVLTPSEAFGTPVALNVNAVPPPHKTSDGNNTGDLIIPSQEEIEAIPTAPPNPPPAAIGESASSIGTLSTIVPLAIPASADISAQMPPVGNQGDENSCVGWASGYAIKSYQEALEHKWALSGGVGPNGININHVFSPAYIYNQINGGKDNGSQFSDAFGLLEKQGDTPWTNMPYVAGQYLTQPSAGAIAAAKPYIISTYYTIPKTNLAQAKSYLAQGYPVFWGAEVDSHLETGTFNILNLPFTTDSGGHAMTFVGYDDTKQAFRVMNSWGTNWGQSGFFWVSYDWVQNSGHMSDLYVLIDSLNDPSS